MKPCGREGGCDRRRGVGLLHFTGTQPSPSNYRQESGWILFLSLCFSLFLSLPFPLWYVNLLSWQIWVGRGARGAGGKEGGEGGEGLEGRTGEMADHNCPFQMLLPPALFTAVTWLMPTPQPVSSFKALLRFWKNAPSLPAVPSPYISHYLLALHKNGVSKYWKNNIIQCVFPSLSTHNICNNDNGKYIVRRPFKTSVLISVFACCSELPLPIYPRFIFIFLFVQS